MRAVLLVLVACGGGDGASVDAPAIDAPPGQCQPLGVTGQFFHDAGNPHLVMTGLADPDLVVTDRFELFATIGGVIDHATSADGGAWTVEDPPALAAGTSWDTQIAQPSVAVAADAPPDRRYLMIYAGANAMLEGHAQPAFSLGAAFSADGVAFTRAQDAPVVTGLDAYPTARGATVFDPEVAYVDGTYQLWFSSLSCAGTGCATTTARGIGHATSPDGIHWTVGEVPVQSLLRAAADPTSGGRAPAVAYDAPHCRYEMWMSLDDPPGDGATTAGVWHATSSDGVAWHASFTGGRDLQAQGGAGEQMGMQVGADVAIVGTGRYLVYVGIDDAAATTLELATRDVMN